MTLRRHPGRVSLALGALALALVAQPAAAHARKPPPYIDVERGFQVALPTGWLPVQQDTGEGASAPVMKATNDATGQWLVVVVTKGPTDDSEGDGQAGLDNFESGFRSAMAYQRVSIKRRDLAIGKRVAGKKQRTLPAIDLWFTMQRDGKPVVVGARTLLYKSYALTIVVDAPGTKVPRSTRTILESFKPAPAP